MCLVGYSIPCKSHPGLVLATAQTYCGNAYGWAEPWKPFNSQFHLRKSIGVVSYQVVYGIRD